MHISITGRRLPITTALRDYIERKLGKLQKYTHRSIEANIILGIEKYRHRAEILFHINNHRILVKEETNEMYQSIDKAVAKIEMRFKKHKGKIAKHHKDKMRSIENADFLNRKSWAVFKKRPYRVGTMSFIKALGGSSQ